MKNRSNNIIVILFCIILCPIYILGRLSQTISNPGYFNIGGMLSNVEHEAFFNETIDVSITFMFYSLINKKKHTKLINMYV
jgi:hypothetical protein